ncbi:NUMOD1 domain-containing DNA-binding protein [Paracoccus sulfuroxidans]|uniref:NUMOD1 domain-containing protein n=1 Tax=Paracoccus sulfuroxidans TaxID=384678 RepID=A0A562NCF1_9RHOB|nr:NUMOD1 domain-containing DNA-binding protein [Paracoccus sulfuroxidans]TWI29718.1 NUMOD1 domain-containing protein [Paracoccus sulfuroxidans]
MSRKTVLEAHGFSSPTEAARALGVSTHVLYKHIDQFGSLDRVGVKQSVVAENARSIDLPDGTRVASITEASRLLGCTDHKIHIHLKRYGHLRFLVQGEPSMPDLGAIADLADEPAPTGPVLKPVTSYSATRRREVDVEAVIETFRQCRDQYLEAMA